MDFFKKLFGKKVEDAKCANCKDGVCQCGKKEEAASAPVAAEVAEAAEVVEAAAEVVETVS